ncbi:hypothetical protein FEM48_Zijuj04G0177000 [Ziziphus jujuba var. spinosa]|uniref:Uncharacterized protein n=1 Tax=Ziziphus jujuba var. spinosa TaxID=714518 RepID=A0A978VL95_ZIZJJ|nr:hypothetical protein FEM48_Zijuj04G0177000 [Ziziphus jujuba var. spinosa]
MLSLPVIDAFAAMIAIFFSQTVLLLVGGDEKFLRARNLAQLMLGHESCYGCSWATLQRVCCVATGNPLTTITGFMHAEHYENGHVACSSCWCNIKKKCPSARGLLAITVAGLNIEKVLEAVRISCSNTKHGCKELLGTYASTSALPVLKCTFNVTLRANERFQILQEQDEGVILILNDSSELLGSLLTVSWMWHCSFSGFFYDIVQKPRETLFDYKSCT